MAGEGQNTSADAPKLPVALLSGIGAFNVLTHPFNARGDGIKDDTAAVQAAINAAAASVSPSSALGLAVVYLPFGTYLINAASLVLRSNVYLLAHRGAVLKTTQTAFDILTGNGISNFAIDGLAFTGPGAGNGGSNGIALTQCDHFAVRNNYFTLFRELAPGGAGIVLTRCTYGVITQNTGDDVGYALVNCFASSFITVSNNIHKNTRAGFPTTCVYVDGSAGSTPASDVTVTGNVSDGDTSPFQVRINASRVSMVGNIANNFKAIAFIAQASVGNPVTDVVFVGNVCLAGAGATDGIVLDGCTFCVADSNLVSGPATVSGMSITSTSGVNPTDNIIRNNLIRSTGLNAKGILTAVNSLRAHIIGNRIDSTNSDRGILVQGDSSVVESNLLTNIGFHGIDLVAAATNSIVTGNRILTTANGGAGINNAANNCEISSNVIRGTAGAPIANTGANVARFGNSLSAGALLGRAVLVAGTVTVLTAEVLAADNITLATNAAGGTLGILSVGAIVPGVSFVINSSNAADTSTVFWQIVH